MGCGTSGISGISRIRPLEKKNVFSEVIVIEPIVIERARFGKSRTKTLLEDSRQESLVKYRMDMQASAAGSTNMQSIANQGNSMLLSVPNQDELQPHSSPETARKNVRIKPALPRSLSHRLPETFVHMRNSIHRISEAPHEEGSIRLRAIQSNRDSASPSEVKKNLRRGSTRNLLSEIDHRIELVSVRNSCRTSVADGCVTPIRPEGIDGQRLNLKKIGVPLNKPQHMNEGISSKSLRDFTGYEADPGRIEKTGSAHVNIYNTCKLSAIPGLSKFQTATPKACSEEKHWGTPTRKMSRFKPTNGVHDGSDSDALSIKEDLEVIDDSKRSVSKSYSRSIFQEGAVMARMSQKLKSSRSLISVRDEPKDPVNNISKRTELERRNSSRAILVSGQSRQQLESFRMPLDESKISKRLAGAADQSANFPANLNSSSNLAGVGTRQYLPKTRFRGAGMLGSGGDLSMIDQHIPDTSSPIVELMRIDASFDSSSARHDTIDFGSIQSHERESLAADLQSSFVSGKLRSSLKLIDHQFPSNRDASRLPSIIRGRVTSLNQKVDAVVAPDRWLRKKPRNLLLEPQPRTSNEEVDDL